MAETGVRAEARAFAAAVSLLTRVPVGSRVHIGDERHRPLAGVAAARRHRRSAARSRSRARALEGRLDAGPAAVLLVAAWALATGAIHLDGLADSADALGGSDRERRLAIMRDAQIGSFGALALVLVVALKIALVAAVLVRGHHLWLIAIPAVGRARSVGAECGAALRARAGHRRRARERRPARRAPRRRAGDGDRRRARVRAPARPARRRGSRPRGPGDRPPRPCAASAASRATCSARRSSSPSAPRCWRCSPGGRRSARVAGRLGVAGGGQVAHAARATWRACRQAPRRDGPSGTGGECHLARFRARPVRGAPAK